MKTQKVKNIIEQADNQKLIYENKDTIKLLIVLGSEYIKKMEQLSYMSDKTDHKEIVEYTPNFKNFMNWLAKTYKQ